MNRDRQVAWGTCEGCGARYFIAPSEDHQDELPPDDEWTAFPSCFVCDENVSIDGTDPEKEILL